MTKDVYLDKIIFLIALMNFWLIGFASAGSISNAVYIPFDEKFQTQLIAPNTEKIYLSFYARIDYPTLAGSGEMLRIKVNGKPVLCSMLVNKKLTFTYQGGRTYSYCDDYYNMWTLQYSPDFTSNNVAQQGYRVLEGHAYDFTFDITSLVNRGQMNTFTYENTGSDYISKYQSEMTQRDINTIRSVKVVISDIELKGIGAELINISLTTPAPTTPKPAVGATLIKSVNPQSIKKNQTVTITITIENVGTTPLSDIEMIDTVPTDFEFISGDSRSAYSSLKPGETRTIQYTIISRSAGKFTLDAATARFADQSGNYQTIKSNTPIVEVLAPLSDVPITTKSPGFEGIAAVAGILFLLIVFNKRY